MLIDLNDSKLEMKLKVWDAVLKGVTSLILIVTAVLGVITYLSQRRELIEQNQRYEEQRTKELNSIIYRTRSDIYIETTDVLARFARAKEITEAEKAVTRFWELYHGKTSIVEDTDVRDELNLCADFIEKWETCKKTPPPYIFQDLAYDLSQVCRGSLAKEFPVLNPLSYGKGGASTEPVAATPDMIKEVCGK